jgi:DNA-binding NtrC family response regulator
MSGQRVLIVDDDRALCELLAADLEEAGYEPVWQTEAKDGLGLVLSEEFDAVVTDLRMADMNGIDFCRRVAANRPDVPVIVLTAFGSMETAVAAIRAGAYDFITKPIESDALLVALERATQHRALRNEVRRLREVLADAERFDEMIGSSPAMRKLYTILEKVAGSDASVLIVGETGTGKELVARGLHNRSGRSKGPFVAINCAAMPAQLLESEIFGHTKGAFTDARTSHPGVFVQADGGTLFLDEIGELPLELQPKLLRALEERRVRPIGSTAEVSVDARLMAASNRDLEVAVEAGQFREDLLFRINVIQIDVPPLRARGNDVLLLAQRFLDEFARRSGRSITGLTSGAADRLLAYAWPGNVRELRNCIERAVTLTEHDRIVVSDLPGKVRDRQEAASIVPDTTDPDRMPCMAEIERRYIEHVLATVGGNKSRAAQILGFDRKRLYRKLDRHGISTRRE